MKFIVPLQTAVILVAIAYILFLQNCQKQKPCPSASQVAVVTIDTQKIIDNYTAHTKPKPDTVYRPGQVIWKQKTIPGKPPEPIFVETVPKIPATVDTQAIINGYYSMTTYQDSLVIPDKFRVYINDTVHKNRITGRVWRVQSTSSTVTKTIRQIFVEGTGYNSKTDFISAGEFSVGYMNRNGQSFSISRMRTMGQWQTGIRFHQPLFQF